MEVRPDFRDRVEALCSTIPTSAMHMLLKAVLPKEVTPAMKAPTYAVDFGADLGKTRTATEQAEIARSGKPKWDAHKLPEPPSKVPGTDLHKPKTKAPKGVTYRILQRGAHRNHNSNTDRYWMACAATGGDTETRSRDHIQAIYTRQGRGGAVDFAWLQRMGYIEIMKEGEN